MLYPEEGTVCCSKGTHILGPAFNPPIDPEYMDFLMQPHVSQDSRLLNSALAMGSQGVFPNKAMGGVGFVQHSYGHVFLMGKVYLVMRRCARTTPLTPTCCPTTSCWTAPPRTWAVTMVSACYARARTWRRTIPWPSASRQLQR